ncbi:MAG: hypothetical protein IJ496_07500, partial [Ruminococcus sp.]|nr:hypothetical protein [Ruminococcus sp.]
MKMRLILRRLPCTVRQNWMQNRRQLSVQTEAVYRPIGFAEQIHYRPQNDQALEDAEQLVQIFEMLLQLSEMVQNQKPSPIWQNYIWNVQYQAEETLRHLRTPQLEIQRLVQETLLSLRRDEGGISPTVRETLRKYIEQYAIQCRLLEKEHRSVFCVEWKPEKQIRLHMTSRLLLSGLQKYSTFFEKHEETERIVSFLREQEHITQEKKILTVRNTLQSWLTKQPQPLQEAVWTAASEYVLQNRPQETSEQIYLQNEQISAVQKLQYLIMHSTVSELYHLIRSMSQTETEFREQLQIRQKKIYSLSYAVSESKEELLRIVQDLSFTEQEWISKQFAVVQSTQMEISNISLKEVLASMTQETYLTQLECLSDSIQHESSDKKLCERFYSSENIMKLLVYHTAVKETEKHRLQYVESLETMTVMQQKLFPYAMIFSVGFATYFKQQLAKSAELQPEELLNMYMRQITLMQSAVLKRRTERYEDYLRGLFSDHEIRQEVVSSENMLLQSDIQFLLQQTQLQTLTAERHSQYRPSLEKELSEQHITDEILMERYIESLTESEREILAKAIASVTLHHASRTEKSLTEQLYSLTETEQEELQEYLNERYIGKSITQKLSGIFSDKTLLEAYTETFSETERSELTEALEHVTLNHASRTEKSLTEQLYSLTETEQEELQEYLNERY